MANWDAYRISDIVTDIDERKFVLPVIQRRLVWEEEKMELLFDTLLKGDSFGGIMVIREEKNDKPLFNFRPFTRDGKPVNSSQVNKVEQLQYFVIDGQQRLQSFYIGLLGSINGKILYFDLFSNYDFEFEFKFESDFNKLPKQAKPDSIKTIKTFKWISVSRLLRDLKAKGNSKLVAKEIISREGISDDGEQDCIEANIYAFYINVIGGKCVGVSEVAINTTLDETANRQRIVELFRRLNDGGTKLSSFDLVASILKGFAWEMESFLEETLSKYSDIGLSQDNLIKLIFLLRDNHNKEMTEIDSEDSQFTIESKERIENTLSSLRKFLQYSDLYNYYKDSNRSFIPLFFIAYHIFYKQLTNADILKYFDNYDAGNPEFERIKKWIYFSLINGVFRSRGAGWIPSKTGVRKILEKIKTCKNNDFPTSVLFNVYREHGVTFRENFNSSNLDNLDSSFLYYLIYDRKPTVRTQDIDHIMPLSILESKGYDWSKINSIRNYQLLDFGTNRGQKNSKSFSVWINNSRFVDNKTAFVQKHLIPTDENIWSEDKFEEFIEARADLIIEKIKNYLL
jgi:uncharacterized protein with ParB-like and HNH nuclease domain